MSDVADRSQIADLFARYLLAIDERDEAAFAGCFAEDGTCETPFGAARGREALRRLAAGWHASGLARGKHHFGGPSRVDLSGDAATARSYYWILDVADAPRIVASGTFEDRLVRTAEGWRFALRRHTVDPSFKPGG